MINSVGGSQMMPGMQRLPGAQRQMPVGGVKTADQVDNDSAQRTPTARVPETGGRAASEAKGMFVDIYA